MATLNPLLEQALKVDEFKPYELALLMHYMSNPQDHSLLYASFVLGCSHTRLGAARKRLQARRFLQVERVGKQAKVSVNWERV